MKRSLWLYALIVSVVFALVLSSAYLVVIRATTGTVNKEAQRSIYTFLAQLIEREPYQQAVQRLDSLTADSPALTMEVWVLSAAGQVLATNSTPEPPELWRNLDRPEQIHGMTLYIRFFPSAPELILVRLRAAAPTYLLVRSPRGLPARRVLFAQSVFFILTLTAAIFLGISLTVLYLRRRSDDAKAVISRLRAGDLTARFSVRRLDSFAGLMLDFNQMADEIGRLVHRLQSTESARRDLLQELGHDLRTPLTSLRTSIEILAEHRNVMPPREQTELFDLVRSELAYCQRLLEDLFFIADIAEPHYRHHAQSIDLRALLQAEMLMFESTMRNESDQRNGPLRCEVVQEGPQETRILGDQHLIVRLFRNALDNALKHACSTVRVRLHATVERVEVAIEDDGPGITPEAARDFGTRRPQRRKPDGKGSPISLGLGSVIMKTILDLHGGELRFESAATGHAVNGTRLLLSLPRV